MKTREYPRVVVVLHLSVKVVSSLDVSTLDKLTSRRPETINRRLVNNMKRSERNKEAETNDGRSDETKRKKDERKERKTK